MDSKRETAKANDRSKPKSIQSAHAFHPVIPAVSGTTSRSVLAVIEIFRAPPDLPNLLLAMKNAQACLVQLLLGLPGQFKVFDPLRADLERATSELSLNNDSFEQPAAMAGRKADFSEWDLITHRLNEQRREVIELIAVEMCRAYLLQCGFSHSLSLKLVPILESKDPNRDQLEWVTSRLVQLVPELKKLSEAQLSGQDLAAANFNLQIVSYLLAQQSGLRVDEAQAAGRISELSQIEKDVTFPELRRRVEEYSDPHAAHACLSFCMGFSMEITDGVEIAASELEERVVTVYPHTGTHRVDLTDALSDLAKAGPGSSVASSLILVRPFPTFLANYLHEATVSQPLACELLELRIGKNAKTRPPLGDMVVFGGFNISGARIVASRGGVFLSAGVPHDTAAVAALSLALISKSDAHYILKERAQIWAACDATFKSIGWGDAVTDPDTHGPAFGTKKTPEKVEVIKFVAATRRAAEASRRMRRYTLESLIAHHNAFVVYVALMFMLICGARNRNIINFKAEAWMNQRHYGIHIDKIGTTNQSRVALPVPAILAEQAKFLDVHLRVFDERLEKLGIPKDHALRVRIAAVRAGGSIDLLFKIDNSGFPQELLKTDVIPDESIFSFDFARFFMPKELSDHGVPFLYIQGWLRHHLNGSSISSVTNSVVPAEWLGCVARGIDKIALDIGLSPIHGPART